MLDELCASTHLLLATLPRFSFPFPEDRIPTNGIYILYEKGETGHDTDRIVRIGTHTGANQLRSRLRQHFLKENKDRSIFRKNIDRALLNRDEDERIAHWELDLTPRKNREMYGATIDRAWQQSVESRVTEKIQRDFHIAVVEVPERDERLYLESRLISTVSQCRSCRPSHRWLGTWSTKEKIRASGLWQVNELYKDPLSSDDVLRLTGIVHRSRSNLSV